MKRGNLEKLTIAMSLALLAIAGGCLPQGGISPESTASAGETKEELPNLQTQTEAADQTVSDLLTNQLEISEAPTTVVSGEKPVPPHIRPTEALADIIRLAQSGVEESVMLAYITNSLHTFSLGPEEIIYLADIGLSSGVVTAMLKHDRVFIENASIPSSTPLAPEPTALPAEQPAEPEPVADAAQYPTEAPVSEPTEPDFHDALAPYGTWVDVGGYGRCWQPSVVTINPDWRPYCDRGHWVYSDCGWYWLSDYSWGWAPFHYGRWFHHNHLGWCWSPGRVWGPSWVSWRYSGDYCGWAPLPPIASFRPGLGFFCGGLSVGLNFDFGIAASCYTFVPVKNFCDYRLRHFALPVEHVARIFNQTVVANNITSEHNRIINHGIAAERVAAATHIPLRPVAVREANAPASPGLRAEQLEAGGRALSVYRPHWDQHPRTPSTIAGQSGTQTRDPAPVSGINGSATSRSLSSQREPARGSGTIHLPGAQAQYASPSSPAGSRRTDPGASRGVARTEPVNSPLSNVRSENIAKAEPATAQPTTTAPLIIRGPGRTGTPSSDATQRHVSRFAANQNSQPFGAPSQSQPGRTSVWGSSRFPQGQENQDSYRNRDQFESRLMTTPSALAARAYYLPNYQRSVELPRQVPTATPQNLPPAIQQSSAAPSQAASARSAVSAVHQNPQPDRRGR